jgi:hypothetical protein
MFYLWLMLFGKFDKKNLIDNEWFWELCGNLGY